jgi:hypothetical protein
MRTCMFCGGHPLTNEDAWPLWVSRRLGLTQPGWVDGQRGAEPARRWRAIQPGVKLRFVCARCNNGWMSDLENRMKPVFDLLLGNVPVTIDQSAQTTVSAWAVKNAMVFEALRVKSGGHSPRRSEPGSVRLWRHPLSRLCGSRNALIHPQLCALQRTSWGRSRARAKPCGLVSPRWPLGRSAFRWRAWIFRLPLRQSPQSQPTSGRGHGTRLQSRSGRLAQSLRGRREWASGERKASMRFPSDGVHRSRRSPDPIRQEPLAANRPA